MSKDDAYIFYFVFCGGLFLIWVLSEVLKNSEQGTYEEREFNPDLNTNDFDQHWRRLNRYKMSTYRGEMIYMGPKGGIYTYTANGNKNYR